MRRSAILCLVVISIALLTHFVPESFAGSLTQSMIRLSRQQPSTATGGLICARTPSSDNGVENSVQIAFPSSFSVSSTPSNWSVDTNDLPAGSSIWPGIGNATAVSGQTVTFPSSNLSVNTTYCFSFDSSNTLTTPSSTGSYEATIRTRNAGNSTIDTVEIGIPITSNDGIVVSATAPANPSDFQVNLDLTNSSNSFSQNSELNYRLTYGSSLSSATSITVEVEWDLGVIQGVGTPTEDILDYVVGSASNGYNGALPIVDLVNRKISWTIPSIPGNTHNQTVTFKLKTNSSYKNTLPVTFSVHGRVLGPGTQTADSTVISNYYNSSYVTPTPMPTCVPSECPTPTPSNTPTPTPVPPKTVIESIDIRSITSSGAAIFVATNKPINVKVWYGSTPTTLNKSVSSNTTALQHLVELNRLSPGTRYLFRVYITDQDDVLLQSGLYVIDTASESTPASLLSNSLIVSSGDVLLTNSLDLKGKLADIIIPFDTPYSFRFAVSRFDDIKSIRAMLRPQNVLGISSNQAYADSNTVFITEINPGLYIGQLQALENEGEYKLVIQIQDYNGNMIEQSAANLYIVTPFTVVNSITHSGVENVKATFYFYNYRLRKYELLSSSLTSIKNPNKSGSGGVVDTVLPAGKYKADLSVLGYKEKSVEFVIGPNTDNYPIIELTPLPFSIQSYIQYTFGNILDAFDLLNSYIDNIKSSTRFLELVTLFAIILFITLAFMQLSRVFGVSVIFLPFYAAYHLVSIFYKPKHTYFIEGKVLDVVSNNPIGGALLHFSSANGKVVTHTLTNGNGEFAAPMKNSALVKITISKKGYTPFTKTLAKTDLANNLTIVMGKIIKPEKFGLRTILWYIESLFGSLFAAFLVITIVIEVIFAFEFGIAKALPCIIVSFGNLLLWGLHAKPKD